jgi:hypothetical protein
MGTALSVTIAAQQLLPVVDILPTGPRCLQGAAPRGSPITTLRIASLHLLQRI